MTEPNYELIEKALRESIERQVQTCNHGLDADLLARFVTNVIGNLCYTVADLIAEHTNSVS